MNRVVLSITLCLSALFCATPLPATQKILTALNELKTLRTALGTLDVAFKHSNFDVPMAELSRLAVVLAEQPNSDFRKIFSEQAEALGASIQEVLHEQPADKKLAELYMELGSCTITEFPSYLPPALLIKAINIPSISLLLQKDSCRISIQKDITNCEKAMLQMQKKTEKLYSILQRFEAYCC